MKTLMTIFASLLISLVAFAGDDNTAFTKVAEVAEGNIEYSIYAISNTEKIKFSFEKGENTGVTVKIYSESFDLLYSDRLSNANEGSIAYNLKELGSGTYHVKVVAKGFSKTHTFSVGKNAFENTFAPYISALKANGKVHVAFQKAFAPVSIKLYDTDGVMYHNEIVSHETSYHEMLNLSQLSAGEYTVEVSSAGKVEREAITIK